MTSPKNIVITGASSGLGMTLALEYAQPGVVLGLIGRNGPRLETVANLCRDQGATVLYDTLDVSNAEALGEWLSRFDDMYPLDLCIANAGISAGTGGGGESLEQIRHIFDININGVVNTIHPVMKRMVQRGKGQLALVASIAGFRGSPTAPAYSTSKAAVRVYGQALRGMLAPTGVSVHVINPGFIKTPMTEVNGFPMPFILTADKAAKIIRHGLACNKPKITFPGRMALLAWIQNLLPDVLMDRVYRSVPAKPSNTIS